LVKPYLEDLRNITHDRHITQYLRLIDHGMQHILSPFAQQLSSLTNRLSPMETKIASLINSGTTTKDMAVGLNVSPHTIKFHRKNIRLKLGLRNQKVNLRSHLAGKIHSTEG
jgi:DNA-binding CsgD family transcriptional regulator